MSSVLFVIAISDKTSAPNKDSMPNRKERIGQWYEASKKKKRSGDVIRGCNKTAIVKRLSLASQTEV